MGDTEFDFGFTAVDEDELKVLAPSPPQPPPQPAVSSAAISAIQARLADIDAKLVAFKPASPAQLTRVEEKIDRVLNMELGELSASVHAQGENLSAVLDEVEERSNAMREDCKIKTVGVGSHDTALVDQSDEESTERVHSLAQPFGKTTDSN